MNGDIMYADLDGNGVISNADNTADNSGDRKVIGNSTPRFKYGVTLDAAWKGIDFRVFFQGVAKRDYLMNGPYFWGANGVGMWQATGFKEHWDFWRPEGDPLGANTDAYYPRVIRNDSKKAGMSSVRVYISGDNLFTFSHMSKIFDPEALESAYNADNGKLYPLQRTISVGLNVNF